MKEWDSLRLPHRYNTIAHGGRESNNEGMGFIEKAIMKEWDLLCLFNSYNTIAHDGRESNNEGMGCITSVQQVQHNCTRWKRKQQ